MHEFNLNLTYVSNLKGSKIGDLTSKETYTLLENGRVSSFILEKLLTKWFDLDQVKGNKHWDHTCPRYINNHFDQKTWTKYGLSIQPSVMKGAGRKYNKEIHLQQIINYDMIYICCSVINLPQVLIRFEHGKNIIRKYTTGRITNKHHDSFFGNDYITV